MKYKLAIITLSILAIFSWAIARPHRICGDCMEPAITDGHLYFSNQFAPYLREYKINDIITFTHEDRLWISRIVALENDTIEIKGNEIIVNGIALKNSISRNWEGWEGTYAIKKTFTVPANHVYVLSDNLSAHHDDSRVFGPINKSKIGGLIW
jgi:signal peptidase I